MTLIHPSAPVEKRAVVIASGEVRTLDVVMALRDADSERDGGPVATIQLPIDNRCLRDSKSAGSLFLGASVLARDAHAFVHVVRPGETLAHIAERVYGQASRENVLVGANALDVQGGTTISPGMHLVVPAPMHHTVARGETSG